LAGSAASHQQSWAVMNIVDRFEGAFERLFEGSIGRVFRSPIQPAEIGRKLERAMTASQVVSVDAILVPNAYLVTMHPRDMVVFADFVGALCRQMEAWLRDVAAERGWTMIGRVQVQIIGSQRVPRRAIRVTASIADRPVLDREEQDEIQQTEVYRVIRETAGIQPVRLRFTNGQNAGQEVILRQAVTTVGRAWDNDIVLDSADVSRYHARLELSEHGLHVVDLQSMNGTRVNGKLTESASVRTGHELTFGTIVARVVGVEATGR
jgi:hypothetical protein